MGSSSITNCFSKLEHMIKNHRRRAPPTTTKPCPIDDKPLPSRSALEIQQRPHPFTAKLDLLARVISILILEWHISATDAICVALACKYLHRTGVTFSQLVRQAAKEDGPASILHRLEPTLPGRFLCLEGPKLVRLRPAYRSPASGEMVHSCCHTTPRNIDGAFPLVTCDHINFMYRRNFNLIWCDARMATSYALYGPGHGIHPRGLGTSSAERSSVDWFLTCDESWDALVTRKDGNLLLRSTRKFRHQNAGNLDSTVDWLQNNFFTVCPHQTARLLFPAYSSVRKPGEDEAEWACQYCHTDCHAKMKIEKHALRTRNYQWCITVIMYYDVGPCREQGEQKWESFKQQKHQDRTPGAARSAWEAEGEPPKRKWFFPTTGRSGV